MAQGQLLCGVAAAQGPRAVGVAVGPHLGERGCGEPGWREARQKLEAKEELVEQVVGGQGWSGTRPSTATRGPLLLGGRMGWGSVASLYS